MTRVVIGDGWFSIDALDFQPRSDGSMVVAAAGEYDWTLTADEVRQLIDFIKAVQGDRG